MKRESTSKNEITRCNPWFVWRQCCNCKSEFRREDGWRAFTGPFCGGIGTDRYICATCAPDREAADSIVDSEPWIPARPNKAPAAPPRAR